MRVLFVVSECAPLVKTGGLADVAGALPGALEGRGCSVRVLLPAYPGLAAKLSGAGEVMALDDLYGGRARIIAGRAAGLDLLLLEAPHLFDRGGGIYAGPDGRDWPDNAFRFAALSWAGAEVATGGLADGWRPDVAHVHDWQTGLMPVFVSGIANRPGLVTTIHNVAYQGVFERGIVKRLRLSEDDFTREGFEYYGHVSFLKAGLVYADAITTVSPTYARELTTPEFGLGLEGVVAARSGVMSGILNGIDLDAWNPETDPAIEPFGVRTIGRRAANRKALLAEFGLSGADGPVYGVVSRLTGQKGLDLLIDTLPHLLGTGASLVLLGSGDGGLERGFAMAADARPDRIGVRIGYDEALSHRIYAGCDALLVPSRFEPCGLTQLYALRYGALPVVARTGGLADTVIDANVAAERAGVATGFQFAPNSAAALANAYDRVAAAFADTPRWRRMQRTAMKQDVSWESSAAAYHALYDRIARPAS